MSTCPIEKGLYMIDACVDMYAKATGGCLTYPPCCSYPEGPISMEPIRAIVRQQLFQQRTGALVGHRRRVRAQVDGCSAWEKLLKRRWGIKIGAGSQSRQDHEGEVLLDVFGRVRIHGGYSCVSMSLSWPAISSRRCSPILSSNVTYRSWYYLSSVLGTAVGT